MMSRGARAERQANLRLLESGRLETDEERRLLEQKYASIPDLTPAQAEEVDASIHSMSADVLVDHFQDYRLRVAGENPYFYVYGGPNDTRHDGDPEMAAAVESVNVALYAFDRARLYLGIAEFLGGRIPRGKADARSGGAVWSKFALFYLWSFEVLVSGTKAVSFCQSFDGGDLRTLERENFKQLWLPSVRARAMRKANDQSTQAG